MARRFLVPRSSWDGTTILLPKEELYHARRVLRLNEGDKVVVFDGQGTEVNALIDLLRRDEGRLTMIDEPVKTPPLPIALVLLQALPKGKKMEQIVEDATELGASTIAIVLGDRSVARPDERRSRQQTAKWARRAAEAAKQCRRATVPQVRAPSHLTEALASKPPDAVGLVAFAGADSTGALKTALASERPAEVWLAVGPEGGWSGAEVALLRSKGFVPIALGPRILRTETAGPSLLAIVGHVWGDVG